MGHTSPKTISVALSVLLATGACAPDEGGAAVDKAQTTQIVASQSGNFLAGRYAQKNNDFRSAAAFLGWALEKNPDNEFLLQNAFLSRVADGAIKESIPLAREINKRQLRAPTAELILLVDAVAREAYSDANRLLVDFSGQGLVEYMKSMMGAWIKIGQTSDIKGAIQMLSLMKDLPNFGLLYQFHAALMTDVAGMTERASGHFKLASEKVFQPNFRVVQGFGLHLERTGKKAQAKTLYDNYLSENRVSVGFDRALRRPDGEERAPMLVSTAAEGVAEVLFYLASVALRRDSQRDALILGQLALYLRPDFDLARMLVAGILEGMGRNENAIAVYRAVDRRSAFFWSARLAVADNLEALDRDDEAIRLLRGLAKEDKVRAEPLVSLGDILRSNKRFKKSVFAYDRAIARLPDLNKNHWAILYSRGISLERSKQWKRAELDFKHALELEPNQPYVLNYLGYSWVDQGINLYRARKMIERAAELRPTDGYIVDSLGWVLFRMKDFKAAVRQLERAVELRPNDPTINDHLGDAYWQVGRYIEARFQWKRALALKPEEDRVSIIETKLLHGLKAEDGGEKDS